MEKSSSWQKVGDWYDSIVGEQGHYYHQKIVLPGIIRLLDLQPTSSLLDLACGQGVLARHIPQGVQYVGVDAAKSLIAKAKTYSRHTFLVGDITKPLPLTPKQTFTHASIVLALQNIEEPDKVLKHVALHLQPKGTLVIILNHPAFRIPRQTCWGFDEVSKMQYRKLNCYMSHHKIPIQSNPGRKDSETTWSFHMPLSDYCALFAKHGFVISHLEEWCSDKVSTGKAAKWENRARKEFPLFMAIRLQVA